MTLNGVNTLWRKGKPNIRECMDEIFPRRGSGHYGCGLYAYRDPPRDKSEYLELDVSDLRFFYTDTTRQLNSLIEFAKGMNKQSRYRSHDDLEYYRDHDLLPEIRIDDLSPTPSDVYGAIETTKRCLEDPATPDADCSPPINHLLLDKGYDGVVPLTEEGNQLHRGCVIFRESVPDGLLEKK